MALTDNPYLPFYVRDWLTSNKLKMCNPSTHGILINFMAIAHREQEYGKILLDQNHKQSTNQVFNFASHLAKLLPFDLVEIEKEINVLISRKILFIEGDYLFCPRMVKDAELSLIRSISGKKGGDSSTKKRYKPKNKFAQAKNQANTENEIDIENNNEESIDYDKLLENYNKIVGKKVRVFPKIIKDKFKARLKEGFTKFDIINSFKNASKDSFHLEHNKKYLTLEYFTRINTIEMFKESNNTFVNNQKVFL